MKFQRLDTGEIFDAKTPPVIVFGEATIEIDGELVKCRRVSGDATGQPPALVSDSLGFIEGDLANRRAQVAAHGFTGVEFKPDPVVNGFYQVHFSGPAERIRYEKMRNYANTSSLNGSSAMLSPCHFEQARQKAVEHYGAAE
jgi:hypothetical protein